MLEVTEVRPTVIAAIEALLIEEDEETDGVHGSANLHDIALNSLLLARLVVQLEKAVGGDPFVTGLAAITDLRTVDDLVGAYERVVTAATPAGAAA